MRNKDKQVCTGMAALVWSSRKTNKTKAERCLDSNEERKQRRSLWKKSRQTWTNWRRWYCHGCRSDYGDKQTNDRRSKMFEQRSRIEFERTKRNFNKRQKSVDWDLSQASECRLNEPSDRRRIVIGADWVASAAADNCIRTKPKCQPIDRLNTTCDGWFMKVIPRCDDLTTNHHHTSPVLPLFHPGIIVITAD